MSTLRQEIRSVVAAANMTPYVRCDSWMRGHDLNFTQALAGAGLIGLTWPVEVGGRAANNVDRLVATEELLRVGAPVAAHWIADRQIGPAILRHGTPELQQEFLPRIAAGEVTFCLGMSEPDSGSDLAAVRTRAVEVEGGYRINGRKIWTSHAHRSTHAYVLARTGATGAKHEGLTEFVVDLSTEGVEVRPILDLVGEHHFNEIVFDDVFVPAGRVIGQVNQGWAQVTEQLAFERGGMERVLSTYPLLATAVGPDLVGEVESRALGALIGRLHTLRSMAHGVATAMDRGEAPIHQAALLKHLGTTFEGDVVDFFRDTVAAPPLSGDPLAELLAQGIVSALGATLRGGTTEILLTIIGREALSPRLGRHARQDFGDPDLVDLVHTVVESVDPASAGGSMPEVWSTAVELGWPGISVDESAGGSGGELADLAVVVRGLAQGRYSVPVAETAIARRACASAGRKVDPAHVLTVALGLGAHATRTDDGWQVNGTLTAVPWANVADTLLVAAKAGDHEILLEIPRDASGLTVDAGRNLAGEPRDTVSLDQVLIEDTAVLGYDAALAGLRRTAATLLLAATVGAMQAAVEAAREHVKVREQFGKPLGAFQAVSHGIARMTTELALTEVALLEALAEHEAEGPGWRTLAGRIVASRASSAVASTAHQLLGAMGITQEHPLHHSTLRLWAWRDEQIAECAAARRLGAAALAAGPEQLWDWCVHERDDLKSDTDPWRAGEA